MIGLMGAMPEEMNRVIAAITEKKEVERGNRLYHTGKLCGKEVVAVFSRWGKVAAATTAANLILEYNVDRIIFTGVAGAISPDLNIGDVVIAQRLFQHDMDARPLMRRYEIPLTGKTSFEIPDETIRQMGNAVHVFLVKNREFRKRLSEYGINNPKMMLGDIASGDLFVSGVEMRRDLIRNLPSVVCVEMEGAAVAQVCYDFDVPLIVVRVISDTADEQAHTSAIGFVNQHAGEYSLAILKEYLHLLD